MKFIKMQSARDGSSMESPCYGAPRVRYVRADIFDELVVTNLPRKDEPDYQVEGIVYGDNDSVYDIADFDTLADAEKFLDDLVDKLNAEEKT